MENYFKASSENIPIAIKNLADSNIIAHSTDTLPGLAADATNSNAINKIIKLKKRSGPYSIIISSLDDIKKYAIINQNKLNEIIENSLKPDKENLAKAIKQSNDNAQTVMQSSDIKKLHDSYQKHAKDAQSNLIKAQKE